MDEIAERAGVSKPVLYQHFPGKQELYLALLDESVDELVDDRARRRWRSTTDNQQRVDRHLRRVLRVRRGHGETFRLVFESDLTNEPAVRERLDAGRPGVRRDDQPGDRARTPAWATTRRTC